MLNRKITEYVTPLLEAGEEIVVAMAGFRPITRSAAFVAVFPAVIAGFAVSSATGLPAWVGGGIGGGFGGGLAMWLDQRRAKAEHDGKGLSVGVVVSDRRFFLLELATGLVGAVPTATERVARREEIVSVRSERMQGSGLKRPGVVVALSDGTELVFIPARHGQLLEALGVD
jgi:hypothetical protein